MTTASEGSERVLSSAGKVPSSTVRICHTCQLDGHVKHAVLTLPGAILCSIISQAMAATLVASCSFKN